MLQYLYYYLYVSLGLVAVANLWLFIIDLMSISRGEKGDVKFGHNYFKSSGGLQFGFAPMAVTLALVPVLNLITVGWLIYGIPDYIKGLPKAYRDWKENRRQAKANKSLQTEYRLLVDKPYSFIRGVFELKPEFIDVFRHAAALAGVDTVTPLWSAFNLHFENNSEELHIFRFLIETGAYFPGHAMSPQWGFGQDGKFDDHWSEKPQSVFTVSETGTVLFYESRVGATSKHLAAIELIMRISKQYKIELDLTRMETPYVNRTIYMFEEPTPSVNRKAVEEILGWSFVFRMRHAVNKNQPPAEYQ
jgi:hypothetical protein